MKRNIPITIDDPFYRYTREKVRVVSGRANTTIIVNSDSISHSLSRSKKELADFLKRRIGISATIVSDNIVLKGQFSADVIDSYIEEYINKNVLCGACGNPETIYDSKSKYHKTCKACGTKS